MPRSIPYITDWVLEPENLYLKFDVFLDATLCQLVNICSYFEVVCCHLPGQADTEYDQISEYLSLNDEANNPHLQDEISQKKEYSKT
jgi:hypothetical protein